MNEYDRLYRQAQRYKELYPKGTRILLLHMGDEDTFRKLTDEELAEEQTDSEDMDEDNGPVMGM